MKKDIIIPIILVVLLTLLAEPFGFMPSMATMTLLVITTVLLILFAVFAWREHGADEREEAHIHRADRFGFLSGMAVLAIGIVLDYYIMREISPILLVALIAMILAKAVALAHARCHN